jgi:plasmid maintenance system antidote protein VapI/Zn-dependent peptidase ImmA (M78 family)
MTQTELATRIGRPQKTINEIIKGKAAVTSDTAIQFERALGVPASVWNALEAAQQLRLAQERDAARLKDFEQWAKRVPVHELKKRNKFPDSSSGLELVRNCLNFFGIDTPDKLASSSTLAAFRRSPSFDPNDVATCTWLRLGELEAERMDCDLYDKSSFRDALDRLRALTVEGDLRKIKDTLKSECRKSGVAVCFVAELQHTHVSGAARWISPDKALIQLSCRYKSNDHFWFTFFHECAHVLLHGKKDGFLESKEDASALEEDQANEFAANHLIPRPSLNAFMRRRPIAKEDILEFADQEGIAPGIVVAQLQKHRRLVPMTPLNKLKVGSFDLTQI